MLFLEQNNETYGFKNALIIASASVICLGAINFLHIESGFFALLAITAVGTVFPTKIFQMGIHRLLGSATALIIQAIILRVTHSFWMIGFINFSLIAIFGYLIAEKKMNYFCVFFIITTGIIYYFTFSGPAFALKLGLLWVVGIAFGLTILFSVQVMIKLWDCPAADPISSQTKLDLSLHKRSLFISIRIAVTIMAVILISQAGNFQGGGLQAFITATVLMLQPDIDSSTKQAWYRLLGVLLGGSVTLIASVILWQISHFWMLMLLYGWLLFFLTFMGFKKSEFSYIFLQASIVVTLVLTAQQGPALSMTLLWERLLGVVVGFVSAMFFLQIENILKGDK